METNVPAALNLPPVDQVGFVVKDIKAAIALYEPAFGPFSEMDAPDMEWDYRGRPEMSSLKLAFGKSGDVEIELIQWVSGETPHKEFLDAGREGMHHLRFRVDDHDAALARCQALGYRAIWQMQMGDIAFSYLEREGDPLLLELLQMPAD